MKNLKIVAILSFLLISVPVLCATNWILFNSGDNFDSLYHRDSIVRISGNVRVWVKHVYSSTGIANEIKRRQDFLLPVKGYENLKFTEDEFEYNCRLRKFRVNSSVHYDTNNNVLISARGSIAWNSIPPDSIADILYIRVCH